MPKTKFCQGISDISDSYRAFLIDQGGVLHDGQKAYDGVVDALKELRGRGKIIYILGNLPLREKEGKELLKKVGIGPSLYDAIISPGELIWKGLSERKDGPFENIGKKCYLFHKGGPHAFLSDLDLEFVDDISKADFALVTGWDKLAKPVQLLEEELRNAIRHKVRLICAVPDTYAILSMDYLMNIGLLVRRYQELGGVVYHIGKPYKYLFNHCIQKLHGHDIYPGQTVMIGDTMAHDMLGASMMEIDTCLVKSGFHSGAFRSCRSLADIDRVLSSLIAQFSNTRPTYMIDTFIWGRALPDRKHRKRRELTPRRGRRPKRATEAGQDT